MKRKRTKRRIDKLKENVIRSTLEAPGIISETKDFVPGPGEISAEPKAVGQFVIGDRLGGPERNG